MSSEDGFLTQVAAALSRGLSPLLEATASPETLGALLSRIGWSTSPSAEVVFEIAAATSALAQLVADVEAGASASTLVADTTATITALASLQDVSLGPGTSAPFDDPSFWEALPEEIIALLISEDLETNAPRTFGFLSFLGALKTEARAEDPSTGRQAYDARVLDWGALGRTASSPSTWLTDVYGFGADFDHARFLEAASALGAGLGAGVSRLQPHPALAASYVASDNPERGSIRVLSVAPFVMEAPTLDVLIKPAVLVLPLPPVASPSSAPEGLLLWPIVTGAAQTSVDLGPAAVLILEGDFEASPLRVQVRPSGTSIEGATTSFAASARVDVEPTAPFVMAGAEGETRLELTRAHFGIALTGDGTSTEVVLDAALDEASAVLNLGSADGFLRGVLGDAPQSLSLAVDLAWSSLSGLTFSGSAEPRFRIDTNIRIANVLEVSAIDVELAQAEGDAARLIVSAVGGLALGPFAVEVDGIGVEVTATPRELDTPGNFGLLDIGLGFKPPNGLGLAIDVAGVASGGGYLYIDSEKGQYAGVVDVDLLGVGVTAIGLLATKLPDGSDGWSMFLSLSATFTGLQLGFGFTLNGVGGIIGVNRGLDVEALGDGIRTGALDSILFPDDPVANATRILSDLDAIFPTQVGQYVFGPVAKIGWGTPTIIEADVGIVIQLPDPLTFTLLGSLSAVLPDEEAALLVLNIDVAGTFDATHGTLSIDASLRDSQVVGLSLSGDMAMRASFLDQPSFLLSFGGFNPHFTPPSSFPDLNRLSVSLDTGDSLRLSLWGYFAVTSNTVQFGAGADLWAKAAGLTVEGHFSFDALIQFNPFLFVVDLGFSVEVRAGSVNLFGVYLALMFEGPNPFHVVGTATMKILGIKTSFELDQTIGKKEAEGPRELVYAQALLIAALEDAASWREVPPDADAQAVVLAESSGTEVRVHPAGSLDVIQRVVPLNRKLEKYGAGELGDLSTLSLLSPSIDGDPATSTSELTEWFAPGQFYDLSEDERLSSPSFEEMPGGMRFGDDGVDSGPAQPFTLDYEQIIRDPDIALIGQPTKVFTATAVSLSRSITRSAVARTRRAAGLSTSKTVASPYALGAVTWVVVDDETGAVATDLTPTVDGKGVAWSEARQASVSDSGASAKSLVPAHEIEEAA